jgi:hypothetical protein
MTAADLERSHDKYVARAIFRCSHFEECLAEQVAELRSALPGQGAAAPPCQGVNKPASGPSCRSTACNRSKGTSTMPFDWIT